MALKVVNEMDMQTKEANEEWFKVVVGGKRSGYDNDGKLSTPFSTLILVI
jgi:hypothetical protein